MNSNTNNLQCSDVQVRLAEIIFDDYEENKNTFLLHQHIKQCSECNKELQQMKVGFNLISEKVSEEKEMILSSDKLTFLDNLTREDSRNSSKRINIQNFPRRERKFPKSGALAAAIALFILSIQAIMLFQPPKADVTKQKAPTGKLPSGHFVIKIDTDNVDEDGFRIDRSKDFPEFNVNIENSVADKNLKIAIKDNLADESHNGETILVDNTISEKPPVDRKLKDKSNKTTTEIATISPAADILNKNLLSIENFRQKESIHNNSNFLKGSSFDLNDITIPERRMGSPMMEYSSDSEKIIEKHFASVEKNPISTFSVYTFGESYFEFKKSISKGFVPPVNLIKPEEFINAFEDNIGHNNERYQLKTDFIKSPYSKNTILRVSIKSNIRKAPMNDFKIALNFNQNIVKGYKKIGYDSELISSTTLEDESESKLFNCVALYELQLSSQNINDNILSIHTQYLDSISGIKKERSIRISRKPDVKYTITSHPEVYRSLFMAEFAMYLKSKAQPKTSYAKLMQHATILRKALPKDQEFASFYRLMRIQRNILEK
jgi:hypothetical protein